MLASDIKRPPRSHTRLSKAGSWRIVAAVLMFVLAAPADLHAAKKKKKKPEHGVLAGTVMNQAGEILAGVDVAVSLEAAGFAADAVTDKEGSFSIDVPAEGEYLLRLTKQEYAPFETPVFLALGEQQAIQVKLLDAAAGQRSAAIASYNAGAKAYEARDMTAAKEHFLAATAADPSLAEPFLVLADIYLVEEAYAEAAAAAETYLTLKPGDQKGQMLAYDAYQELGNKAKLEELRGVLGNTEVAPQLAIKSFNEGAMADQKGDTQTAIAKFREALDLDSNLLQAHAGLATVYYRAEQYDEALMSVEELLAGKPDDAQGHRLRFLIQEAFGDRKASDEAMASYIEVDPKGASTLLFKRADLDFRANELDLARATLLQVLELDPEMARAHYTLGKVYASTDTAKAKEHLQKFIDMAPDDPEVASAKEMLSYF